MYKKNIFLYPIDKTFIYFKYIEEKYRTVKTKVLYIMSNNYTFLETVISSFYSYYILFILK